LDRSIQRLRLRGLPVARHRAACRPVRLIEIQPVGPIVRQIIGIRAPGADKSARSKLMRLDVLFARAFSGRVESGFPSEKCGNAKMLERFLFRVHVEPL
jgi:hypothetical protein